MYPFPRAEPKDMSYRKPVPRYLPSPPPSPPPSSPVSPLNRLSLSLAAEIPPLPSDWRQAIGKALTTNKPTRGIILRVESHRSFTNLKDGVVNTSLPNSHTTVCTECEGRITSPISLATSSGPGRSRKRRLHQNYRPPTPPLKAHCKRRRFPDNDLDVTIPHEMSPSLDDVRGDASSFLDPAIPISRGTSIEGASLFTSTLSPSFRTEKTQSSTIDIRLSNPWPRGLPTYFSKGHAGSGSGLSSSQSNSLDKWKSNSVKIETPKPLRKRIFSLVRICIAGLARFGANILKC